MPPESPPQPSGPETATTYRLLGEIAALNIPVAFGLVSAGHDRFVVTNDVEDIRLLLNPQTAGQSSLAVAEVPLEGIDGFINNLDRTAPEAYANKMRVAKGSMPDMIQLTRPTSPGGYQRLLLLFRGEGSEANPFIYQSHTLQRNQPGSEGPLSLLAFANYALQTGQVITAMLNQVTYQFLPQKGNKSVQVTASTISVLPRDAAAIAEDIQNGRWVSGKEMRYLDEVERELNDPPSPADWSAKNDHRLTTAGYWFDQSKGMLVAGNSVAALKRALNYGMDTLPVNEVQRAIGIYEAAILLLQQTIEGSGRPEAGEVLVHLQIAKEKLKNALAYLANIREIMPPYINGL